MEEQTEPETMKVSQLFLVENMCPPDSPRAKKVLVYRFVVMAKDETEAKYQAARHASEAILGTLDTQDIEERLRTDVWHAEPIGGAVCAIPFVLRNKPKAGPSC